MQLNKMQMLLLGVSFIIQVTVASPQKRENVIQQVPFTDVQFTDQFWAPRIEINRTVSIPSAFQKCEENGRFDNFALAGKLIEGEHQGDFPFDDTDPYKIIEGASYALAVKYDAHMDAYLDSVINLIVAAQEEDGYITTCVTNKCERLHRWWGTKRWEKLNSHELYNSGHLYEAAVAHFKATGKRTLLNVALKNADLVHKTFGPAEEQIHQPSGHPIIEMGLAKLYKVTGEEKYLQLAKYFIEEAGRGTDGHHLSEYSQDHMPILEQEEIKGHAVRAGYLFSGVADYAALTGDTAYFNALLRIWNNMASKKLYITGGIGSRAQGEGFGPNYELHNHTAYCETCASISNVYWNERMFLATGDAKYVDVLERALYNGVLSGVSLSGDRFFYDNPLASMGQHSRQPWFGCACCPGNITRFVASVPRYMYGVDGKAIYVNLYGQSDASVDFGETKVGLHQTTKYPWNGKIRIEVFPEKKSNFVLNLRIPGWAKNKPVPTDLYAFVDELKEPVKVTVNGKSITLVQSKGYVSIPKKWKKGDVVELELPMPVRRVKAHANVKADVGMVALQRGPIVYCLEGKDQQDNHVFNKYLSSEKIKSTSFEKELLNGVVVLNSVAKELDWSHDDKVIERDVEIKAIPYSVWNNRGQSEMAVWLPTAAEYARPTPKPSIASEAETVGVWGVNDQWDPESSDDTSKPYSYWWLKYGTKESGEYKFKKETLVSGVEVYWLDFAHYDGDSRIPESWKLYYKDGEEWKEVEALNPYTVEKDQYNVLKFTPVKTTGLKIVAQLQEGESGGILEWKVK